MAVRSRGTTIRVQIVCGRSLHWFSDRRPQRHRVRPARRAWGLSAARGLGVAPRPWCCEEGIGFEPHEEEGAGVAHRERHDRSGSQRGVAGVVRTRGAYPTDSELRRHDSGGGEPGLRLGGRRGHGLRAEGHGRRREREVDLVSAPTGGTLAYEYKPPTRSLTRRSARCRSAPRRGAGSRGPARRAATSRSRTAARRRATSSQRHPGAQVQTHWRPCRTSRRATSSHGRRGWAMDGHVRRDAGGHERGQATVNNVSLTGAPAVTNTTSTAGDNDLSIQAVAQAIDNAYYEYITGDVPGTYTLRILQDTNGNEQLDAADERATELITMTVVDAGGTGTTAGTTADDVAPVITATTPIAKGLPVTATIGYTKSLSTADARGTNVSTASRPRSRPGRSSTSRPARPGSRRRTTTSSDLHRGHGDRLPHAEPEPDGRRHHHPARRPQGRRQATTPRPGPRPSRSPTTGPTPSP